MSQGPLYKLAMLVAAILFVVRVISGNTVLSSLGRAAILFIGILSTFLIAGQVLKFLISLTEPDQAEEPESESAENGKEVKSAS